VLLMSLIMGSVLAIDRFSNFKITVIIAFISIVFPFIWCLSKGKINVYYKNVKQHTTSVIPSMKTEFTLFISAGIFGQAFLQSPFSDKSVEILNNVFGYSSVLISIVITSIIILTAIIGIHPVVMLTIFVTSITPNDIGVSNLYFAALLLISIGIANAISPATAVNNLISYNIKENIFTISLKWNWIYVLLLFIILPIYLHWVF